MTSIRGSSVVTYVYDALNHRIKKTVGTIVTLSYFNQNWQEIESIAAGVTTTNVYGLRYIDDVVCRVKNTEVLYALQDTNWNVVALVTPSGVVAGRMTYDSFGKPTFRNADFTVKTTSSYGWTKTFTGQVYDSESGLMLYRNRYYHTGLGRFITRDPVGYDARDINLYRYVQNNTLNYIDSFGYIPPIYVPSNEWIPQEKNIWDWKRDAERELQSLCTDEFVGDVGGCTKEQCIDDAKKIADAYVEMFFEKKTWRVRDMIPIVNMIENDNRNGWVCYEWQWHTWQAIKDVVKDSSCFQCNRVGNATLTEQGMNLHHNWVAVAVASKECKPMERKRCGAGVAWLDPWRGEGPAVYLPDVDNDDANFLLIVDGTKLFVPGSIPTRADGYYFECPTSKGEWHGADLPFPVRK